MSTVQQMMKKHEIPQGVVDQFWDAFKKEFPNGSTRQFIKAITHHWVNTYDEHRDSMRVMYSEEKL